MDTVLVATYGGVRVFPVGGEARLEIPGQPVGALVSIDGGACLAIVNGTEVWRRSALAEWSPLATVDFGLTSIASVNGRIYCGGMAEASIAQITANNTVERLAGLDSIPGRSEWFPEGPPMHVRSMTGTADGTAILAVVHVGGIPRSVDDGMTWEPTLPILHDVHDVRAHRTLPIAAAAAAVGLCVSHDCGKSWDVIVEGLDDLTDSLAVAVLDDEVLFSIQDGPFANRSQIWRWKIGGTRLEQVREGLPHWLDGKTDTGHMAAGKGRAAVVDGGGNVWLSSQGSLGWEMVAREVQGASAVVIL